MTALSRFRLATAILAVVWCGLAAGLSLETSDTVCPNIWDIAALSSAPEIFSAKSIRATDDRIRALFFASVPFHGKPTRIFAWLGIPKHKVGVQVPGIILLHGGGGTAFESWVKLWLDRGYAAIAIDTFGGLPDPADASVRLRNPDGGPTGGKAAFAHLADPVQDQWPFQAVSAAILANSLLRAQPDVDPALIGVTGISWGGYLTCIFASVDPRLRFAASVYGCGHLDDSVFGEVLRQLPLDQQQIWRERWDASVYLSSARVPTLWVNGTNDHFFWLPAWQSSYRQTPKGGRTLSLRVGLKHGHPPEGDPPEITAFADSQVYGARPLVDILRQSRIGHAISVSYSGLKLKIRAELIYTEDVAGAWENRLWKTVVVPANEGMVRAVLPTGARLYFINLIDDRGLVVSTEHETVNDDE